MKLAANDRLPSVIPGVTVTIVSKMFPFTQVDNIRDNLPFVLKGLVERTLGDKPMVLTGTGDHSCRDRKLPTDQ